MSSEKISDERLDSMARLLYGEFQRVAIELQSSRRTLKQCEDVIKLAKNHHIKPPVYLNFECELCDAIAALREGDK